MNWQRNGLNSGLGKVKNLSIICTLTPSCGSLDALGINIETFKTFIATKPSYPQLESWVKSQPGVKLTKGDLNKHNQAILGYIHDDATRKTILDADGIADDGSVNPGAVDQNNLDDWHEFHAAVLK